MQKASWQLGETGNVVLLKLREPAIYHPIGIHILSSFENTNSAQINHRVTPAQDKNIQLVGGRGTQKDTQ